MMPPTKLPVNLPTIDGLAVMPRVAIYSLFPKAS